MRRPSRTRGRVAASAHPEWSWSTGSAEEKKFFSYVVNPSCGTCHWALADTINRANRQSCHPNVVDSSYTNGQTLWDWTAGNWTANQRNASMLLATRAMLKRDTLWLGSTKYEGHLGYIDNSVGLWCRDSVTCFTSNRLSLRMPNAQPTFNRFWGEVPQPAQNVAGVPIQSSGQWWLAFASAYSEPSDPSVEPVWTSPSQTLTQVLIPTTVQCDQDSDCGQKVAAGATTDGNDSGRRCALTTTAGSSLKVCNDGSSSNPKVNCSGMEKDHGITGSYDGYGSASVGSNFTMQARLKGNREEATGSGTCVKCGRIGQTVCATSPACHEGRPSSAAANATCVPVELIKLRPASKITAIPGFVTGNDGAMLLDGNDATYAMTASTGTNGTARITVDLGTDRTVQRIRLVERATTCRERNDYAYVTVKSASGKVVVSRRLDMISDDPALYKDVEFLGGGSNYPIGRTIEIEQTRNIGCNSKSYPIVQLATMEIWGWNAPWACSAASPDCVITGQ